MQYKSLPQLLICVTFALTGCMSSPISPLESYLDKSSIDETQSEQLEKLNQYLPLLERLEAQEKDISQFVALTMENSDTNVVIGHLPEFVPNESFVRTEPTNKLLDEQVNRINVPNSAVIDYEVKSPGVSKSTISEQNKNEILALDQKPTPVPTTKQKQIPIVAPLVPLSALENLAETTVTQPSQKKTQDLGGRSQPTPESSLVTQSDGCKPKDVIASSNHFGVHVYSVQDKDLIMQGWGAITEDNPVFCERGAVVKKVNVGDKTFHSLRIGPYKEKSQAKLACELVRQQKKYCRVTDFSGDVL